MMFEALPKDVQNLINGYFNLEIGGKKVAAPYYRNKARARGELRVLVGKGAPREIEEEVKIYSKLRAVDLTTLNEIAVREFMKSEGIGVDCSGYVCHILSTWLKSNDHGSLRRNITTPPLSLYRRIVFQTRTIENISADLLTSELNCTKIHLRDIQIGDLIRLKGVEQGHHVAIIVDVEKKDGQVFNLTYTHSTERFTPNDGVRVGNIRITDENKELIHQEWQEVDVNGKCWTFQGLTNQYEDNGLRRLKFHHLLNV